RWAWTKVSCTRSDEPALERSSSSMAEWATTSRYFRQRSSSWPSASAEPCRAASMSAVQSSAPLDTGSPDNPDPFPLDAKLSASGHQAPAISDQQSRQHKRQGRLFLVRFADFPQPGSMAGMHKSGARPPPNLQKLMLPRKFSCVAQIKRQKEVKFFFF